MQLTSRVSNLDRRRQLIPREEVERILQEEGWRPPTRPGHGETTDSAHSRPRTIGMYTGSIKVTSDEIDDHLALHKMERGECYMPGQPRIVHIPDSSELAPLLEEPDLASLRLERRGVLFRVSRDDNAERDFGPSESDEDVVRHLDNAIGSWKRAGVDAEAFKEYIRERRKTRNRPSVRL
jgi:hypothetical protein